MIDRAAKRLEFARCQNISQDNASFVLEQIYEIIRECGQSLKTLDGYKADNSHEAIIAFVNEYYRQEFGEKLIADFDRYRILRHNSVYSAAIISPEITEKAPTIAEEFSKVTAECMKAKLHKI